MRFDSLPFVAVALVALVASPARALTLDLQTVGDTPATALSSGLLAAGSGISIIGGTEVFQGSLSAAQSATYSSFSLAPSSGSTPTLTLPNGIFLTSGTADIPFTNTANNFNPVTPGSGPNAQLTELVGTNTDANAITFSFTVSGGQTSVSAQFVFGTDEFPLQPVTDIFGFFVDDVNYAKFPSGELISNTPGNPTNFISNPVSSGLYGIEYNGLTQAFTVTGILDSTRATHTITVAVADTFDNIFDSGVFIGGLTAGSATGGGGITPTPSVPEAASTLALLGLAIIGLGLLRRKLA